MTLIGLRLLLFCHPKILLPAILVAGGGYLALSQFGINQTSAFKLDDPLLSPIEVAIRKNLAGEYSQIALTWAGGILVLAWRITRKPAREILSFGDRSVYPSRNGR